MPRIGLPAAPGRRGEALALPEVHQVHKLPLHGGQHEDDAGLPHMQLALPLRLPRPVGEVGHAAERQRAKSEVA